MPVRPLRFAGAMIATACPSGMLWLEAMMNVAVSEAAAKRIVPIEVPGGD